MSALTPVDQRRNLLRRSFVFSVCALVIAAFVVANQSTVHWRENVADDHLYSYAGWRIWQGDQAYVDVWDNKPPGIWWVNALGFAACGEGVGAELLVCSAALTIAILAFAGAARQAYGRGILIPALLTGGVLLSHLRYECGANRTETYVAACECLAIYGYLRWLRTGKTGWLALAGLAGGAAPCFKQNGVSAAFACGMHLLWTSLKKPESRATQATSEPRASARVDQPRGINTAAQKPLLLSALRITTYAAALIAAPGAAAIYLAFNGALGEAWFAVIEFNRYFFAVGDATWFVGRDILERYAPHLAPLRELAVLATIGAAWGVFSWRKRKFAERDAAPSDTQEKRDMDGYAPVGVGVFWVWLIVSFYLACVGTGRLAYHLAPALPPLGMLALYPLAAFIRGQRLGAAVLRRPSSAAALVAYFCVVMWVLGDSLAHARKCWASKPAWNSLQRTTPADYELQAAAIREWTSPDDRVYVWGWSPGTYRFAYRRCPSRYATIEHVSHVAPHGDFIAAGARRDVRRNPPAVFVISIGDYDALMNNPEDEFANWVRRMYLLRETIAGMNMLVRR